MRVTELSMVTSFLNSVSNSRAAIDKLNLQISTQKKINSMSDDPTGGASVLRLKGKLSDNEQYQSNITIANAMMTTSADALSSASDVFVRLKETLARATSATKASDLAPFASDVQQMFQELLQLSNTSFNGKFIFGGTQTKDQPYTYDAATNTVTQNPNGVSGTISLDVSPQTQEPTNISGDEAFNGKAALDAVLNAATALANGTLPSGAVQQSITDSMDQLMTVSVKAGTTLNRLDAFQIQLGSQNTSLKSILSKVQDTDIAQAIVELQHQQTILDSSLKIGAQVIPKTLVDFI
jgi:flagellar hook-associated protein 3 FlgL